VSTNYTYDDDESQSLDTINGNTKPLKAAHHRMKPSGTNETAMLMDAIQSLQALHQKSRVQSFAFGNYASDSLSETSSSTPEIFNGANEHRQKIRELTIALEAQAMDETKRFAMASPATRGEIRSPRVSPVPKIGRLVGMSKTAKDYLNDAAASWTARTAPAPKLPPRAEPKLRESVKDDNKANESILDTSNPVNESTPDRSELNESVEHIGEISVEESPAVDESSHLDEQRKKMEILTRELDAQLNVAMQAQAYYKANPYAVHAQPSAGAVATVTSPKNAVNQDAVAPAETLSTELDTTVASSSKRVSALTSAASSDGMICLNEDFEPESTSFEAPLSPNSFFVVYGMKSTPKLKKKCVLNSPEKSSDSKRRERKKSGKKKAQHDEASKPSGTFEMIVSVQAACFFVNAISYCHV
jgi:hypothetical protein